MPILFNQWRPAHQGEERIDYQAGMAIVIYRGASPSGQFFWRIAGSTAAAESTGTTNIIEARKVAMRRADLVWRQVIDQNAAALLDAGTGITS